MVGYEPPDLEALVRIVIEDAQAACRRHEDRALNESRRLVTEAEDRIADLRDAARDLGRTRGEAADAAQELEADREIRSIEAAAFEALWERFRLRLGMRLESLPESDAYAAALTHWASQAAGSMDGPSEVFTAKRDRLAVYEALLAAGAEDFHVRVDHAVHVGFVVRDLDGRTRLDRRPEALIGAHEDEVRKLLESGVPAFKPQVVPAAGGGEPASG